MQKKVKTKKCKQCNKLFTPVNSLHIACSYQCALLLNQKKQAKIWSKEKKERKEKLKTKSDYLNELQAVFNSFIRERDKDKTCISCGKKLIGKFDAGHFYTTGSSPEIRFNELNVNGQCTHCNMHEHGNILAYRAGLIKRIGIEKFESLEKLKNIPAHYSVEQVKEMIVQYKEKLKKFKNDNLNSIVEDCLNYPQF